jgi:hypothetical protein
MGGDPDLNERGIQFSRELHDFISNLGVVAIIGCILYKE